jgi:hypothetical protein
MGRAPAWLRLPLIFPSVDAPVFPPKKYRS